MSADCEEGGAERSLWRMDSKEGPLWSDHRRPTLAARWRADRGMIGEPRQADKHGGSRPGAGGADGGCMRVSSDGGWDGGQIQGTG